MLPLLLLVKTRLKTRAEVDYYDEETGEAEDNGY